MISRSVVVVAIVHLLPISARSRRDHPVSYPRAPATPPAGRWVDAPTSETALPGGRRRARPTFGRDRCGYDDTGSRGGHTGDFRVHGASSGFLSLGPAAKAAR